MSNELAERPVYETQLTKVADAYMPQIEQQLMGNGINMTDYQKMCVMGAIQAIDTTLQKANKDWNTVDRSNVTNTLLTIAALQLNASAVPREIYFISRNLQLNGKWTAQIEMGIEGDGNDAILSKFGRNIKRVHRFWEVREGDKFTYPGYKGIDMTPPNWQPTGEGKVIRVVYPVEMTDGVVEYHIAERKDVVRNLIAHINQNLMNETFGFVTGTKKKNGKDVARTRYDATDEEKKKINAKKKELMTKLEGRELDELITDKEFEKYISPAWKSPQSRESMIVRKMRNNVVKKIPKNFENAYVATKYLEQDDEVVSRVRKDVSEQSATELYDFEENDSQSDLEPNTNEEETVQDADYEEIEEETTEEPKKEEVVQTELIDEPVKPKGTKPKREYW